MSDTFLTIRIPSELRDKLRKLAEKENRSMSMQVHKLIQDAVEKDNGK